MLNTTGSGENFITFVNVKKCCFDDSGNPFNRECHGGRAAQYD